MILTLNEGKLIVNIPISKDGSNWFNHQRRKVLFNFDSQYLSYSGGIKESSYSRREMIFAFRRGHIIDSIFKYDLRDNVCYFNNKIKGEITKYELLLPSVTDFWING